MDRLPAHHLEGWRLLETANAATERALRPGDRVVIDTRGGSFALTMPAVRSHGDMVEFAEPYGYGALAAAPLTLMPAAGEQIDANAGNWSVNANGAHFTAIFNATANDWLIVHSQGVLGAGGTGTLDLTGLANQMVRVNGAESGFVAATGIDGGTL